MVFVGLTINEYNGVNVYSLVNSGQVEYTRIYPVIRASSNFLFTFQECFVENVEN